ncbi:MAG: hypothetical protein KGQ66_17260 [Acidobacteriota bacterium]|nr:hypothetical protein [Acidobacteriota bacterium]
MSPTGLRTVRGPLACTPGNVVVVEEVLDEDVDDGGVGLPPGWQAAASAVTADRANNRRPVPPGQGRAAR